MPWPEVSTMSLRREFVELAQQAGPNRRALGRAFSISPTTGYRWLRRYQTQGPAACRTAPAGPTARPSGPPPLNSACCSSGPRTRPGAGTKSGGAPSPRAFPAALPPIEYAPRGHGAAGTSQG